MVTNSVLCDFTVENLICFVPRPPRMYSVTFVLYACVRILFSVSDQNRSLTQK